MEKYQEEQEFSLYRDIEKRTNGEIYIGVVGPVRTGKSTFIKRFMKLMVIPNIEEEYEKARTNDEMPQSASGKTITTTEPKFIPKEGVGIRLSGDTRVKVRMIDCVGYMVDGALGHLENNAERMVKTPWYEEEIPFTKAAEIGTQKVIREHSTIGVVVVCDGSFGEINRENYRQAEERTISELKQQKKPFVVVVNSAKPEGENALKVAKEIEAAYEVPTVIMNCESMTLEEIHQLFSKVLYEFPVSVMEFYMPRWLELVEQTHPMKQEILTYVKMLLEKIHCMNDVKEYCWSGESQFIRKCFLESCDLATGIVRFRFVINDLYYYELLSEMTGEVIRDEYALLNILRDLSVRKKEYTKVSLAMESVRGKGYGVITPEKCEINLKEPEIIRHGNKYGVKIKAESPSIHMIKAVIETEIAPIVGTQEQAQDLISYIKQSDTNQEGIWDTNIFGKSVEQLVQDGIANKIRMIDEKSQMNLQDTMQKIVNESTGGMVCIII